MGFSSDTGPQSPRGIMVLNPAMRSVYDWFRITQAGCQLRIYPELGADGKALPIRVDREVGAVGSWVNSEHYGISYLGGGEPSKEKITLLVSIVGDAKCSDPSQRRGLRLWDQLRQTLYYRLNDGTAPSHWSRWATNSRDSVFGQPYKSKAKPMCFVRGMLTFYMTGKGPLRKVSSQNPRINCVFSAGPAAQQALVELVMTESDNATNYKGDDWDKVFKYNSKLVHPVTGCLINFGRVGQSANVQQATTQAAEAGPINFGSAGASTQVANDDIYRVEATLLENNPCPIPPDILNKYCIRPWDEILQVWSDEKDLLSALEVGFPDDLIIEAFKDQPEFFSDRLKNKARLLANAAMGGNVVVASQVSAAPVVAPVASSSASTPPWAAPAPDSSAGDPSVKQTSTEVLPEGAVAAAPSGSQPDGIDLQGMEKMMEALKNVAPPANG